MTNSERAKAWNEAHPERVKATSRRYTSGIKHNPERLARRRAAILASYYKNKEAALKSHKRWRENNPNAVIADRCRAMLRCAIYRAPKKEHSQSKFKQLVGCSRLEFRAIIAALWSDGMSWDNYGNNGWTLGHKIACASYDLTNNDQLHRCFHWSNIKPEWAIDNRSKHSAQELTAAQVVVNSSSTIPVGLLN